MEFNSALNPLNVDLNPIWRLQALLGAHHILHGSRIKVKRLRQVSKCHIILGGKKNAKIWRRLIESPYSIQPSKIYRTGERPSPSLCLYYENRTCTHTFFYLFMLLTSESTRKPNEIKYVVIPLHGDIHRCSNVLGWDQITCRFLDYLYL